jgi:5-formyltetrahydrofolate cyclo-ligase
MDTQAQRQQLRQQLRLQRQALTAPQRAALSAQASRHAANHRLFRAARHIACYLANDAELDLTALINQAWAVGKTVYLPVLSSIHRNHLHFLPYAPGDELVPNRFGIPEPVLRSRRVIDIASLDLVFTPLVGFDSGGNRLGMGGGFYDRTFAFLRRRHSWRKPRLLGVAFDCQRAAQLPPQPWDVPLDAVVTESGVLSLAHAGAGHDPLVGD